MKDNKTKSKKGLRKNKYSHLYKTRKLTETEYQKSILNFYFTENEEYLPIIREIEKRFNEFFKTLHRLTKHKKELEIRKEALKVLFYNDISLRVRDDTILISALDTANGMGRNEAVLDKFKSVIDGAFVIPSLVLSIFKVSSKAFKREIRRHSGLKISDPQEQKLFQKVWKINKDKSEKNIKFSPYATFKKINDKFNFVNGSEIQPTKFTESRLYNRYKQYRLRQQKSNS